MQDAGYRMQDAGCRIGPMMVPSCILFEVRTKGQMTIRKKAKVILTTVYDSQRVRPGIGFPSSGGPPTFVCVPTHASDILQILHLASCILHLASCILHLASCILHLKSGQSHRQVRSG
jgi:hypothetical protein